jgi:N12 class adenine-specific DNA methylase
MLRKIFAAASLFSALYLMECFVVNLYGTIKYGSWAWDHARVAREVGGILAGVVVFVVAIRATLKRWAIDRVVKTLIEAANRSVQQSRNEECDAYLRAIIQIALQTGFSRDLVEFAAPTVVIRFRETMISSTGRFDLEWLKEALRRESAKNVAKGILVAD